MSSAPAGWNAYQFHANSVRFSNEEQRVEIRISPTDREAKGGGNQPGGGFLVQVQKGWFGEGTIGDRNMSVMVDTWNDAITSAREFMVEFNRELVTRRPREVETTHRSVEDARIAETMLATRTTTEAMAETADYSDELLLDVLATETNGQHRLVAHRSGSEWNVVYRGSNCEFPVQRLEKIRQCVPVDKTKIDTVLSDVTPARIVTHLEKHTVYRFVYADETETDIVLSKGTHLLSPLFEEVTASVLDGKWGP